jgi:hypothetical protein
VTRTRAGLAYARVPATDLPVIEMARDFEGLSAEVRANHRDLSPAAEQFLDFLMQDPERLRQLNGLAAGLPDWTRTYPDTQLTWPTFVGGEKLRQIKRATVGVTELIRSVTAVVFDGDCKAIADFYGYANESVVEQLLLPPNGLEGAVARCDFIDGVEGFKCCEVNMASNVGGWECQFWEQKYFGNPVISEFLDGHGLKAAHHNPLRSLCAHIVEDTLASGVRDGGELNVAVVLGRNRALDEGLARLARETYATHLREADEGLTGELILCSDPAELSMRNTRVYRGDRRIHAFVEYYFRAIPDLVLWCQKAGTVCVYNGLLVKLLVDKRNLALLSEFEDSEYYDADERALIRDHIPWSRIVAAGQTRYRGETVTLPRFLTTSREALVLKPALQTGGVDVYVGRFTPAALWEQTVERALGEGGWIVQEYIEPRVRLYTDGVDKVLPHVGVWGMFSLGRRYGGGYHRLLPHGTRGGVINSCGGAVEGPFLEV